jgi:hypothetical protein
MKTLLLTLLLCLLPAHAQAADATGHLLLQAGKSFPHAELSNFLSDGTAYRLDLFGGAKLQQIKFLSAIGLGIDVTYTNWRAKNPESGWRFKQYQWDMFKLPISLWLFVIEPGFLWMVTDVAIPHKGIDQTSIRPGINLNLGFRLPILPHFNLRADGRIQRVMLDKERTNTNEEMTVTGQSYSWLAGFELFF